MKIASVVPYAFLPYQSGGQKSIAQFYEYLGKVMTVHLIGTNGNDKCLAENYHLYPLLSSRKTRYINPVLFFRISRLLKKQGIKTIIFEHPYYAWLIWLLKTAGYRTVLHSHNIEYVRFHSVKKWWWPLLRIYEKWAFKQAHIVFFISREDMDHALADFKLSPAKCHVIPFGIPVSQSPENKEQQREMLLKRWALPPGTRVLLFTGHYGYQPNIDAAEHIIKEVAVLLQARYNSPYKIIITGKGLPEYLQQQILQRTDIIYAGFVEDIESYFTGADALLNTVLSGGGVKTKLIEAIGHGTSVISTETGALGVDTNTCAGKLFVAKDNDWDGFVEQIKNHVGDQHVTDTAFYQSYYWGNIAAKVVKILSGYA